MDKSNKTNLLLSNLLGNTKHRGYKDMLADLKTRISAFELQSYSDLADSLSLASEKLQNYPDDFDINDKDAYDILGLLLKPGHGPEIIRRLFCIQELITMITYTTPKALPELRSLIDQIINNLRFAICETGLRISSEYTPMSYAARAWDCLVHFNKMSHYERSSLMKLTDQKTPDQKIAFKASEKLTDKYEKWASFDIMTYPYNDDSIWFYESVILNESNQNLYDQVMNYLLCLEDIDSIDKISRIHCELRNMIRNIQNYPKSKDDDIVITIPDIIDKARQLAESIREATVRCEKTPSESQGNQGENQAVINESVQAGTAHNTTEPPEKPQLNEAEGNIIEALSTNTFTGEIIAEKAGYPYNSNFKATLSAIRKRGIIGNKSPGYFLQPKYLYLLDKPD